MKILAAISQRALALFLMITLMVGCLSLQREEENSVVLFLEGAELQIETESQAQELAQALEDMLRLSSEQLRERRYQDYQMKREVWTLTEILSAYFLPEKSMSADLERFYTDATTEAAKSIIHKSLQKVQSLKFDQV